MSNLSCIERVFLSIILDNTINKLEIAKQTAAHCDVDYLEREHLLSKYKTLQNLMQSTREELLTQSTYSVLHNYVEYNRQKQQEHQELARCAEEAKVTEEITRLECADEEVRRCQEMRALHLQMGVTKDRLQADLVENAAKIRYACEWIAAQCAQHAERAERTASEWREQIAACDEALEAEHRVHDEIDSYHSMMLGEYIGLLVDWVDKYERDKKAYDDKITELRSAHAGLQEKIAGFKQLYESRKAEMQAYEELKELRRIEAAKMANRHRQATKIQAWWKGMMVRCKLGPYKPKKGKARAKSKKK